MIRAAIIGASGYAGYELTRLLALHKNVEIAALCSHTHIGKSVKEFFPWLDESLTFISAEDINGCDVAFSALPPTSSAELCGRLLDKGIRVIDLSADFRFSDLETYQSVYNIIHPRADLIPRAVYGLSEIYRNEIKKAELVANPGCYVTSVLLPLIPLVKEKVIDTAGIIIDAKSGVSGAGRKSAVEYSFCELEGDFKAYSVIAHRHSFEIAEKLGNVPVTFCPHLLPVKRGILSTIYCGCADYGAANNVLKEFYQGEQFVKVCQTLPSLKAVTGTNGCCIGTAYDQRAKKLVIVSVLDNLLKGAAGQAVQNMNIMFGQSESCGLEYLPNI